MKPLEADPTAVLGEGTRHFSVEGQFPLESGGILPRLDIIYETYGHLNNERSNAVLVCHALTGSAHAADSPEGGPGWWGGMIGKGKGLDTNRVFVISPNILGSCYGSTGPASIDPRTGRKYRMTFPQVTVRDMVRAQKRLIDALGIAQLAAVTGGSLGGMQALEWGIMFPESVRLIVPIATSAQHSAWCIGISEAQRLAITSDPSWMDGEYEQQPACGLALARMIAMISYRSRNSFEARFGRTALNGHPPEKSVQLFNETPASYQVESYLRYQGEKLVRRFDANTYLLLTRAMDLHDVSVGRGSLQDALGSITAQAISIGISSDLLYPTAEQRFLAEAIPHGEYAEIDSLHGHDAFLIDFDRLAAILGPALG
jgi:homoserine O-acetyltransferase